MCRGYSLEKYHPSDIAESRANGSGWVFGAIEWGTNDHCLGISIRNAIGA